MVTNRIEILLKNLQLSQSKFAEMLDVDPKTVRNWIQGKQFPNVKYLPKIMEILKVADINHIFLFGLSVNKDKAVNNQSNRGKIKQEKRK